VFTPKEQLTLAKEGDTIPEEMRRVVIANLLIFIILHRCIGVQEL
jgi:hypothetical protein